nr:beta-galactosidase [uncultured Gemmiger sp.]
MSDGYWKGLLHSAVYAPQRWAGQPEILRRDLELMHKAGVNMVTLAAGAWPWLEPREGEYAFDWLDDALNILRDNGIRVILCAQGQVCPSWLARHYPGALHTAADGTRPAPQETGGLCPSHTARRKKVREIDEQLARRYGTHPAVLAWLVTGMDKPCYCASCQKAYRAWLRKKYTTLGALNEAGGTAYSDWEELAAPEPDSSNLCAAMDWESFCAHQRAELLHMETEAIRKGCPDARIMTDLLPEEGGAVADLTLAVTEPGWRTGSDTSSEWNRAVRTAFAYDRARCAGRPFVARQLPGAKCLRPGILTLSLVEAVACGADGVEHAAWRQLPARLDGHAVVSRNGSAETRFFRETSEAGQVLQQLPFVGGMTTKAPVALLYDGRAAAGLAALAAAHHCGDPQDVILDHYAALLENYIDVDVLDPAADWSGYKVVAAPLMTVFSPEMPKRIEDYVQKGGHFLLTFGSGLTDENGTAVSGWPPAGLNNIFGVGVEECDPLLSGETNSFTYDDQTYPAVFCCDILRRTGARMLSAYEKDFYRGQPAVTKRPLGYGCAWYLGCHSEEKFLRKLYSDILREAGVPRLADIPYTQDLMLRRRTDGKRNCTFFMNFSSRVQVTAGHRLDAYGCAMDNTWAQE